MSSYRIVTDEGPGIAVEPIRRLEDVQAIKDLLADRPRDLLLFSLGVNNGLRAGDLLRVTVGQARHASPGQYSAVRDKRSSGHLRLAIPSCARDALRRHLETLAPREPPNTMYLFAGEPGWGPLRTERLDELVVEWTRSAGLSGRYGAHTLRKTFGYLQRTRFGVDFAVLAGHFGHPSPAVTMRYLGLTAESLSDVELHEI